MTKLDKKINNLKAGQSIIISGNKKKRVSVERSGDGKLLRFIRNTPNSSNVFKTCPF